MSVEATRHRANRLRGIALEAVLLVAGAQRDRYDKAKWHTAHGTLSVSGMKFMSWARGFGGGGAIDLVIHLYQLDFKAAVEWLSQHFPSVETAPAAQECIEEGLKLPRREAREISRVRQYLVHERCLAATLIEPLIEAGRIYADPRGNAVFLLLGEKNKPVGAELRGTTRAPWRGMAPGTRKDLGYFSVWGPEATKIVLCESAIDALSCFTLDPQCACISTAGARPNPRWLTRLIESGHEICCGFDSDETGDDMALAMIALHPTVKRLRPPLHDWNDVLTS